MRTTLYAPYCSHRGTRQHLAFHRRWSRSDVKMNVVEPARLFESMVGGRPSPKRAISPRVFAEFARRAT